MTPRVALLTTSLGCGGAEAQVVLLATGLARRGYRTGVVSLAAPTAFTADLKDAGVEVVSLSMRAGVADPRGLWRLIRFLARFRPAILHSHLFHANLMARVVRLVAPVPVVISTLHSIAESGRRHSGVRLRDLAYRLSDPLADQVVAVCQAASRRHLTAGAVRASKLCVIPNAVDTGVFRPDAERRAAMRQALELDGAFVWLAAGRLMWKKDYPTMLRAFACRNSSVLLVAGTGPQGEELRELASRLGVRVRWLGARDDMPALMNAADALVLSSVVEGLPVVLLEAAASGLIAVSTDAGGAREAVEDGATGYIVPIGDAQALSQAISRVESLDEAAREQMARAARRRALALFDIHSVTGQWERLYGELLERARRQLE